MSGITEPDVFVLTLPTHGGDEQTARSDHPSPLAAGPAAVTVASTGLSSPIEHGFGGIQLMIPRTCLTRLLAGLLGAVALAEPRYLRRAEEFLDTHADRPIGNAELATAYEAAGLSVGLHSQPHPARLQAVRLPLGRR